MSTDSKTLRKDRFEAEEDVPLFLYTYNFKPSLLEDSKQKSSFSSPGKKKNIFTSFSKDMFRLQCSNMDFQCFLFVTDYLLYQNHKIPTLSFRYTYISNFIYIKSVKKIPCSCFFFPLVNAGGSKAKTKHIELETDA